MTSWRWLLPAASLLVVGFFTWRSLREERRGPGPLHPAHAAVPALQQGTNCQGCHRPGAGVDADRCSNCHTAIAEQRRDAVGLHGALTAPLRDHCERCHGDHHGDGVPLIAPHAWSLAGIADRATYEHAHVAFTLRGAHKTLACVRCHARAEAAAPPEGGRFLGARQDCTSCHDDAHRGAFGVDCQSCHGQERPWREAPGFAHARFALRGAHGAVACASCHTKDTAFAVAAEQATPAPTRACRECHADPHQAAAAPGTLRLRDTADCARCHATDRWATAHLAPEQHAALGFALRGPHAAAACAACHGDGAKAARWAADARGPELAACAACHTDPHRQELVAAATAAAGPANGCAGCHTDADSDWRTGRMQADQHRATGFALDAPHADVACARCHAGATRGERFPGRDADDCRRCHTDAHGGQFAGNARYGQCTACHAADHWLPHRFGIDAHAATAFPLTGAHGAVACSKCHASSAGGGRTFHGTRSECTACHADVHRGRFDRRGLPASIDGRAGCARCHDTNAFVPLVANFDHARWTGYELVGAHAALGCAMCHPRRDAAGPRLQAAAGTACASCHQDPHAGQFAVGGRTDCTQCHDARRWRDVHFDHARQSRFALDAVHAGVPCSSCHVAYPTAGGPVVRYKPLGTLCGDCHRLGRDGKVRR